MAMCWIQGIFNHHPTRALRVRCLDRGRNPTIGGKKYGADDWFELAPGGRVESSQIDNLAVPWNNEKAQRLVLSWGPASDPKESLQLDVIGQKAWDWLRMRDGFDAVVGEFEVGSLGDAPGINHSGWTIHLEPTSLRFRNEFRQGLKRDDLLWPLGEAARALEAKNILKVVKDAKDIVVEATSIVDHVIINPAKQVAGVLKDVAGAVTGLAGLGGGK
jgi:hypothetical protein